MAKKLTLGKTVASVLIASTLALSVAVGITVGQAYKKPDNESGQNGGGGNQENPFENVNATKVEKTGDYGLIESYEITFDDGSKSTFIVVNGENGPTAFQAFPNDNGYTPTVEVGENGNWIINAKDSGIIADLDNVIDDLGPHIGENGHWWIGDVDTGAIAQGEDGLTPFIGENGNWWIGETDTGVSAHGQNGQAGENGKSAYELACEQGYTGTVDEWLLTLVGNNGKSAYEVMQEQGYTGTLEEWIESLRGQNGVTPHIGDNGNWFIGEQDTGIAAQGQAGENGQNGQNGVTPHIGDNGNWFIGEQDTGVQAQGQDGKSAFEVMQEQGYTGTLEEWLDSLVGQDGQNGKSAYDIYCDVHDGDDLNEAEWLASLVGAAGENGNGIENITGPVTDGLFDTYTINYTNGTTSQFVVKNGQDGKDGTVTLFGNAEPDDAQGVNGDSYINTQTWDYYVKENDAWAQKGNIKGATGANGKSAYEVMQEAGYTGSITEWLESLKGEKGDDGENGKSAYELAKDQGYTGTLQEWLDSLVGQDGDNGKSAYELYCENHDGDDLSEQEWLDSLAGQNGKSAYEIYCELNADPDLSEADWLASLVGQNGQNGKSIYAANGEPDANLGNVGDSYVNVANGDYYVKEDAGWGTPIGSLKGATGAAGNGIASIELTDDTNATKSVYTVTYTDASTDTLEIAKPRSIVSIVRTSGDGSAGTTDTYTITYNYGDADTFTVTHGSNGNTILTGDTAPSDSIGRPGDVYVDYVNQDIYLRGIDDWSVGISFRGEDGRGIASIDKSGPEADGLTYTYTITYTDASTPFVFTVTNGADGADGTKVVTGAELPTVLTNFQEGDAFISTTNWNYYVLQDNAGELEWDYRGNIRGTALYTGHIGDNVPDVEETYKAGDSYLNLDNWNYYVLQDNAGTLEWHLEGNIHNSPNQYTVTFVSNQGTEVDPIDDALEGHTIARPTDPTRNDYYFQGWYTVEGNKWDFTKDVVMDDITLYARWAQFQVVDGVLVGCSASGDIVVPQFFDGQDVVAIGETAFKNKTDITSVILPQTITAIQESSFEGCTGLLSVSVPKTVRSIGENAFKGCINLAYAYLEEGLLTIGDSAFENCESLVALAIPNSVSSIGESTFENCETLTAVVVPDSVTSIGASAFTGCNNLVSITVPYVGGSANGADDQFFAYIFGGADADTGYDSVPESLLNVTLTGANGDNRDQLPTKSFYGCSHIEHINLSENITVVGNSAFENCSGLKALEFPLSVTNFGTNILKGATSIEELKVPFIGSNVANNNNDYIGHLFGATNSSSNATYIPESLKTVEVTGDCNIYYHAFYGCSHLENLIISGTPTSYYGYNEFEGCSSLKYLYLSYLGSNPTSTSGSLRSLFGNANSIPTTLNTVVIANGVGPNHDLIPQNAFAECPNIEHLVLPEGIKIINDSAFYRSKIESIVIPNGVTTIGNNAFKMSEAVSIIVPDSVTSLGTNTFQQCPNLSYVKLGSGITAIQDYAFDGCSNLIQVEYSSNVTSIGNYAFSNCKNLQSFVFQDGITSIGNHAFYAAGLYTMILPSSLQSLGEYAFYSNNFLYYVDLSKCSLLTSIPDRAFYSCKSLSYVILNSGDAAKTIGQYAFAYCSSLTYVVNLRYASSIGNYAFNDCTSLYSIEVGRVSGSVATTIGTRAFYGCTNLTYVYFGSSSAHPLSIAGYAFEECISLKKISIGDYNQNSVGTIAKYAFYKCSGVESVILPYLGSSISDPYKLSDLMGNGTGNVKTVELKDSIDIADRAFSYCKSMTGCSISRDHASGYFSFGNEVFEGCSSLISFSLAYNANSIGTGLLKNCINLTSASLNSLVTSIPNECFYGCSSLKKINDAPGVTSIGDRAFYGCTSFEKLDYSYSSYFYSLQQIGAYAFSGCTSLKIVSLRDTLTSIGNYAFDGCISLESISIPGTNHTTIGSYAFRGCSYLAYAELQDGITSIGEYAFSDCISLKALVVPDSVTSIGQYLLQRCNSLESLVLPKLETSYGPMKFGNFFNGVSYSSGANLVPDTLKVVVIKGDSPVVQWAFKGCANIETIRFVGHPTSISISAFDGCTSLKTFIVPYIGSGIVLGTLYAGNETVNNLNSEHYAWKSTSEFNIFTTPGIGANITLCYDAEDLWYDIDNPQIGDMAFTYGYGQEIYVYEYDDYYDCDTWVNHSAADYGILIPTLNESDRHIYIGSTDTGYVVPEGEYFDCYYSTYASPDEYNDPYGYYGYVDWNTGKFFFVDVTHSIPNPIENDLYVSTISHTCKLFRYVNGQWVDDGAIFPSGSEALYGTSNPSDSEGQDGQYYFNTATKEYFNNIANHWESRGTLDGMYSRLGYWFGGYNNEYGIPESLKTIEITDGVTAIPDEAFVHCEYLEEVVLPDSVKTIGNSAFAGCENLKSINMPSSPNTIGDNAFQNCGFESFVIPTTVTSIGANVLKGCSSLEKLTVPYIGDNDTNKFFGYLFGASSAEAQSYYVPASLREVTILGGDIAAKAFYACSKIETVNLPKTGITTIGAYAFYGCANIERVVIPHGVTTLGERAFSYCPRLSQVVLPNTLTAAGYGDHVFDGGPIVRTIYYEGASDDEVVTKIKADFGSGEGLTYIYNFTEPYED